jgi:NAD-dependent deacetylase
MVFPSKEITNQINLASQLITESEYCVALTGAGISTPSGVPDFRSAGSGLWTKYSPMEVASLSAFQDNPVKFYDWLRPFMKKVYSAEPNPAHKSLAELESANHLQCIVTQNIDALHQKAGSLNVIEVHGTYQTLSCLNCSSQVKADQELLDLFLVYDGTPNCPKCGNILKPDLVLYEELLPINKWNQARDEIRRCDLLLVLGSSLTVTPVCDLPYAALSGGANIIIINRSSTHLDNHVTVSIQGELHELMPIIKNKVLKGNV